MLSKCENCTHERYWHMDTSKPDALGYCGQEDCQCDVYKRPEHEGSDIRDAVSYKEVNSGAITPEEARRFVNLEYDTGTDSLVIPEEQKLDAKSAAETIDAADSILTSEQANTETLTAEQLNLQRISIDSMRPGENISDGDIWKPTPNETLIFLDGHWREPDVYNMLVNAKRLQEELDEEDDAVNHPSHYTAYPGVEVIQLTRWMSFNLGNAVKYVARAGLKDTNKEIQDLEKAIWYIKDEIARKKGEYGEQKV